MTHPDLESARVKLNRAREHIQSLETEHSLFFEGNPQPFAFGFENDVEPDGILGVVTKLDDPSPVFGAIVGDAVHNLHATLDHIAWQLYKHGGCPNLKPGREKQVQFPICDTLSQFPAELEKRIPCIDSVQETIVRRYQPYTRGADAANHPFARLKKLSLEDKHRNIHLTYWCASNASFTVTKRPPGCRDRGIVPLVNLHDPLEVDTKLFQVSVASDRQLCRDLEVQTKVRLSVAFKDGTWVYEGVRSIERLATELLAEVDGVL